MSRRLVTIPASIRLSLFFFALFFVLGVYMPFFPVWLSARGLGAGEIGIVLAVPMVVRIVTTTFTSALADRFGAPARAILVFAAAALFFLLCLGAVDGVVLITVFLASLAVFWMPLAPLVDALAMAVTRRDGADYGRMRLWGSLAFILANLGAGWLVGRFTGDIVFWVLVLGFSSVVLAATLLPRLEPAASEGDDAPLGTFLKRPAFLALLAAGGLCQASHSFVYAFGSLYWQTLSFSGTEIGALWAIGVIAEIVLFSISGRLNARFGPAGLILAAATAAVLRWAAFPFLSGFTAFLAVQVLHGVTFGATHLGLVHHVARSVPERHAGAAQAFAVTIVTGASALSMGASGPLYRAFGGDAFFAMAGVAVGAMGLVALSLVLKRRRERAAA
ncbi:MFS transporter [Rhodobium orientis]|nr:MFS transporter [Rhodobium orientis]